ncbi:YciI family protein [Paraglaciecola aestuariivivens]
MKTLHLILFLALCFAVSPVSAQTSANTQYDAKLAESLGADDYGMRSYVLVILKTGPTPMEKGEKRNEMFKGHMANIKRLADQGKLAIAGPMDGVDGWRGMFIFATPDIETAKQYVATDPVIDQGEMIAEYHKLYASAALMKVYEISKQISQQTP